MGELCELTGRGDTKTLWNPNNPDEVEAARKTFDALRKKGYAAFKVDPTSGEKTERITEFDPAAGKVILVPPVVGGGPGGAGCRA